MGPFPHDAPRATITDANPAGLDGFAFVEFAHPEPAKLHALFRQMGFTAVARHRERAVTLYRQGSVDYLVNEAPGSHATEFVSAHGPCAPSMGWHVADSRAAFAHAIAMGAEPATEGLSLDVPAIKGIGGSLIYFVDRYGSGGTWPISASFGWAMPTRCRRAAGNSTSIT